MNKIQNSFNKVKYCEICKKETFHISGGKICLDCRRKLTGIGIPLFVEENKCTKHLNQNKLFYYKNKKEYICWDCFKEKFILSIDNTNFTKDILFKYINSFMQTTFRKQDSIDWIGAGSAFEQDIANKNVSWFCYIKFYKDENNDILPLVVGKTGSKLVNISGTDVIFSENIEDGPARKFLKENKYTWDKTQILVIPCLTELDALNIELLIQLEYNLFAS